MDVSDGIGCELEDQGAKLGKGKGKSTKGTVQDAVHQEREALNLHMSMSVSSINQGVPPVKLTSGQQIDDRDFNSEANTEEHIEGMDTQGRVRKRDNNEASEAVASNTKRKMAEKGSSDWSSPER